VTAQLKLQQEASVSASDDEFELTAVTLVTAVKDDEGEAHQDRRRRRPDFEAGRPWQAHHHRR
jgi:hypothetical protein